MNAIRSRTTYCRSIWSYILYNTFLPMRATRPNHIVLLNFIVLIYFVKLHIIKLLFTQFVKSSVTTFCHYLLSLPSVTTFCHYLPLGF
jgi:glucose-6-phosphate-specific signal transduction histidine kinase